MTPATPRQPARLTKIEIENYRAFSGHFELDLPEGHNLLIYGENGAGKSSIFHSLTDFLESPYRKVYDRNAKIRRGLKCEDFRHSFNSEPPRVRLTFAESSTSSSTPGASKAYEWSATVNGPLTPEMRDLDKGKGCLDYRDLLQMHLLPTGEHDLDLFPLFVEVLFSNFKNPASSRGRTFAEDWSEIKYCFRPYGRKPDNLAQMIASFNDGFERVIKDAFRRASSLIETFDSDLGADVDFIPAQFTWPPKALRDPRVIARPSFRRLQQPDYHGFLNEARLSALAIAVYFAALEQSPARGLRLLVLDDILIGLDMANRMGVLRIIEKLFREWQVIILTYHKAWFEVLKARIDETKWSRPWRRVTLRMGKSIGTECPVVVAESYLLLIQAREHLNRGDAKAAAVYARSAWESTLSWYCSQWQLPVEYAESRRNLNTNSFLSSIKQHLETLAEQQNRVEASGVLAEIKHARRFILNPNAHFDPELEDEINAEVEAGIRAVEDFEVLLRRLQTSDFAKSSTAGTSLSVGMLLQSAVTHLDSGRNAAAQDALASAFEQHIVQLFRERKEEIPYGAKTTRAFLLNWACRRLYKKSASKLYDARTYLVGDPSGQTFDAVEFRSALQLLVRLQLLRLLDRRL